MDKSGPVLKTQCPGEWIAQQNLGHASLATTAVDVATETKRTLRALQGFWKA